MGSVGDGRRRLVAGRVEHERLARALGQREALSAEREALAVEQLGVAEEAVGVQRSYAGCGEF